MIKPYVTFLRNCLVLIDMTIVLLLFPVSVSLQNKFSFALNQGIINYVINFVDWNLLDYSAILLWMIPLWYFALNMCNAYQSFKLKEIPGTLFTVIHSAAIVTVLSGIIFHFFGFKLYDSACIPLNYSLILIYPSLCIVFLISMRFILLILVRIIKRYGYNTRQIIIVGTGPRAIKHYKKIINNPEWGFEIIGFVALDGEDKLNEELKKYSIIGTIDTIDDVLKLYPVDDVFFVVPRKWIDKIEQAVMKCDLVGVTVHMAIDLFSNKVSKSTLSHFHGLPVLSLNATSTNYAALTLKRFIDIICSLAGIIILSPILIFIAVLIKLESKGPVFFVQERNTLNGRTFNMLKFRTMVENAEDLKDSLMHKNEQEGPVFKIKTDPRITRVGRILRRYSLDEFPQLINVLFGSMSLVGPRPPLPKEVKQYQQWQRRRLSMRPGITCIWQVSGRNEIAFDQWMEMDLNYIDNWSLFLDFKILLKTFPAVFTGKGR